MNEFIPTKLEEERGKDITFTTRITNKDLKWFEDAKRLIRQPKNSTAMKQLAQLGYYHVLHDEKISELLDIVVNNFRKNERTGITPGEYKIKDKFSNVIQNEFESDTLE